ncbi:MAG: hypothetical protein ACXU7D_00315 [Burkholderiaceae bacterium]
MKQFYSCIDALLPAPQPEQHELSKKKAAKEGGQIIFYGAEEYSVVASQPFILNKLLRTGGIDGVVFFTIDQFCYGETLNLKLLTDIVKAKFSVHFAREDISFNCVGDITEKFITLSAYFHALKRKKISNPEELLGLVT